MSSVVVTPTTSPASAVGILAGAVVSLLRARGARPGVVDLCALDLNVLVSGLFGACPSSIDSASGHVEAAHAAVAGSDHVILVSPVFNGSCAGLIKLFLDTLPRGALAGSDVLALGTAGTARHGLALSYALLPVLVEMGSSVRAKPLCLAPNDWVIADSGRRTLSSQASGRLNQRLDTMLGRPTLKEAQ